MLSPTATAAQLLAITDDDLDTLLEEAWQVSRAIHGNTLAVHVPGMFVVNGRRGKYPAVSITGDRCRLDCEHCKGHLLRTMPRTDTPEDLIAYGLRAWERGDSGLLVTGGCDDLGRLPWKEFARAISYLKSRTGLVITVHAGQLQLEAAKELRDAGVDQALVDVIGDAATAKEIYHLPDGTQSILQTMDVLARVGLEMVPHVLVGLYNGRLRGELNAVRMLKAYPLKKYAIVVIMPFKGTPMAGIQPPRPREVALFMAWARLELPGLQVSLGCARPRGRYSIALSEA